MDVQALVEQVIDSAIRGFDPQDRASYDRWDLQLSNAENSLQNSMSKPDQLLLASIRGERIRIAFEANRFDLVVEQSANFLSEFSVTVPNYSIVLSLRASSLHAIGDHEKEIREMIRAVAMPELQGSEYIYFLASLCERHPGCLPANGGLWQKLLQATEDLRGQGYETLPRVSEIPGKLEEMVGRIVQALRNANRQRGDSLLSEP